MEDLISKQKVIDKLDEALERITKNVSKESDAYHIVYVMVGIAKCMIMTIHPEIVRCEECKYHHQKNCPIEKYFSLDGFCSRGER